MWIAVPAALHLWWRLQFWSAAILIGIHVYAAWFIDSAFFAEIPDVNPYFSALAFILGLWAFGLEGLVLGPLLMSVLPSLLSMLTSRGK
jgi:predicted PurR-regulated permease PerM